MMMISMLSMLLVVMASVLSMMMVVTPIMMPAVSFMFLIIGSFPGFNLRMENELAILQGDSSQTFKKLAGSLAIVILTITVVQVLKKVVPFINKVLRNQFSKRLAGKNFQVQSLVVLHGSKLHDSFDHGTHGFLQRFDCDLDLIGIGIPSNCFGGDKESSLASWQAIGRQTDRHLVLVRLNLCKGVATKEVGSRNETIDITHWENEVFGGNSMLDGVPKAHCIVFCGGQF